MQTPKIQIKADSISSISNVRCTTFLIENFPYRLIQEIGTHRLLQCDSNFIDYNLIDNINPFTKDISRNSASTRAIPVNKIIEQIKNDPYIPTFTRNVPGMQGVCDLNEDDIKSLTSIYLNGMENALNTARWMSELKAHKQEINAILTPYLKIPILITATNYLNFFKLRCHESAHPDFSCYAYKMKNLYDVSSPEILNEGEWHLPFYDKNLENYKFLDLLKICSSRNARLSYNNFDGNSDPQKDIELYNKLLSDPLHGSPFEHNLVVTDIHKDCGNFTGGWYTQRKLIELNDLDYYV
jgi:thymidylate synthase ThyX